MQEEISFSVLYFSSLPSALTPRLCTEPTRPAFEKLLQRRECAFGLLHVSLEFLCCSYCHEVR